ncbi:hypothetical protein [Peijinzhouia sedimentorum]
MEIFLLGLSGWLIIAFLLAKAGTKLNKKFSTTFLSSLLLSPIAGLIYLNTDLSASKKNTKRGGPWSAWISKAEEAQNNEEFQYARSCYQNALEELQNPEGPAKFYYKKYILSKISEVNYALTLLENKKDKQVPFNINPENSYLKESFEDMNEDKSNTKTG